MQATSPARFGKAFKDNISMQIRQAKHYQNNTVKQTLSWHCCVKRKRSTAFAVPSLEPGSPMNTASSS
eukprot:1158732-Pelagomonas_calceolata.AAC.2